MSLPLLEGFWRQHSSSERVFKEALHRYNAAKRIAKWCNSTIQKTKATVTVSAASQVEPRRKKRRINSLSDSSSLSPLISSEHWLFQALDSPNLAVRQIAARILLRHKPPVDAILDHLRSSDSSTGSPGDIQCFGILTELSGVHLRTWKWAGTELKLLASHPNRNPIRLVLLIHYLHTMSLMVEDGSSERRLFYDFLWSSPSLMADLIAANVMLHERFPARGLHVASQLLAKLVHPSATPASSTCTKVRSESEDLAAPLINSTNAAKRQFLRLERLESTQETKTTEEEEDEDDEEDEQMEDLEENDEDEDDDEDDDPKFGQVTAEGDDGESENEAEEDDNEDDDEDFEDENDVDQNDGQETDVDMTDMEQDIVDVVRHFEERLMDVNDDGPEDSRPSSSSRDQETTPSPPVDKKRGTFYLQACLKVLHSHYNGAKFLSIAAEQRLLLTICNIIQPPKSPLSIKIFMRRAPSQEEFFRGSLTRNPVQLSHLIKSQQDEPTVRHLRQYIADQLQMSETAELIELLCLNKILSLDLKLRVVHQVLWRTHLLENSSTVFTSASVGAPTFFSTGTGLSMVFSSDRTDRRPAVTADTPASALPPMVVTYRLAGVDGEATEDLVESLIDPEAPITSGSMSLEEQERLMENEYGLTRLVMNDRGVNVLLRSLQSYIKDALRRIRRDDVSFKRNRRGKRIEMNPSLAKFEKSPPCAGLVLLKLCTKLPSNCKMLVEARAPTILLRLLLDLLNAIDSSSSTDSDPVADQNAHVVSNPTAVLLEDLIETVASDSSADNATADFDAEADQESNTLPLLLSSLKTIYLGPQLRKVIAKLLPFLTYGLPSLARELAENFEQHVKVEKLSDCEAKEQPKTRRFVLMETFVQVAICLPPNDVCHSLRSELLRCGFVEKLMKFVLEDMPEQPPPWSTALWPKAAKKDDVKDLEQSWKYYFLRSGIKTALDMLVGLCRCHKGVQNNLASYNEGRFIDACHWIESTSDHKSVRIVLNGLGLLAETLLDELKEKNLDVSKIVGALRRKTRERKKEIADERRSKALVSMSSFGPPIEASEQRSFGDSRVGVGDAIRTSASTFLAPVLGFFSSSAEGVAVKSLEQPAWMAEMEALEDETGLTCAVCQEGRTLQPGEVLGLYCYVKKVAIPANKWGTRAAIDGAALLMNLPSLPTSLVGTPLEDQWFSLAKSTGDSLRSSNSSYSNTSAGSSQRPTHVTTTVSAGNAIHCSCHAKARSADRNHPKAPKSEWEGASLRNSRVNCNVILPLVSSKSSRVPLVAVEMALTEYQTAIANMLGARPKSMLWAVLNDLRLLILRMGYGESLNADCGGGSLSSNVSLLFYQLLLVDMFTNDAEHDSPQTARHAVCLSGGFLAAMKIVRAEDFEGPGRSAQTSLHRSIADAAPMAALTCIAYHNNKADDSAESEKDSVIPHPRRRWELNKEDFLSGLIECAGRRHALGVEDSSCHTNRKTRARVASFSDWDNLDSDFGDNETMATSAGGKRRGPKSLTMSKRGLVKIEEFANALRPMITLYSIFDCISSLYIPNMTDELIRDSADVLVKHIEDCQKANGIQELLRKAGVKLDSDRIIEELQKGILSA